MPATVNSVTGALEVSDLGFTLSHEHVCISGGGLRHTYPELIDRQAILDQVSQALKEAYDEGLRSIIDVTTIDLGRDVELMREVSELSGVNIIPATGNHMGIPVSFGTATPDLLASVYIREVEEGIEGTGIKAGIIKVASDRGGVTELQEMVLRAAARTSKATGTRISTHTWSPDRVGEQQVLILEEEGVDLDTVYIGHSNDDTDMDYLVGLLQKGVWIGLDRHPGGRIPGTPDWEGRTQLTFQLMEAGYTHRIMLAHDYVPPANWLSEEIREDRHSLNPDAYSFISRKVLPRLKELGASDDDIHRIMVDNPRRFFAGE